MPKVIEFEKAVKQQEYEEWARKEVEQQEKAMVELPDDCRDMLLNIFDNLRVNEDGEVISLITEKEGFKLA